MDDIALTPSYTAVQNVALVQSRSTMVLIGTVNIESMKCKVEAGGFSSRSSSVEVSKKSAGCDPPHTFIITLTFL
jgi:hypothetical protein